MSGGRFYRCKKDDNHDEIKEVFLNAGWKWEDTYMIKCGYDGFTWKDGPPYLIEIKDGSKSPSQTKTTELETKAMLKYPNEFRIVMSVLQAQQLIDNQE